MLADNYLTIDSSTEGLYKDKGSKFIAIAMPVDSEDKAKAHINTIKKKYFDARHHCYAYSIIDLSKPEEKFFRINDDGEPSGTAGRPIYGQILSKGIINVLVVVVRYFGGTKLGTSGLIEAYKSATADALNNAVIIEKIITAKHEIRFQYEETESVMKHIKKLGGTIISQSYDTECVIVFSAPRSVGVLQS